MSINRTEPTSAIIATSQTQQDLRMSAKSRVADTTTATDNANVGTKVQIGSLAQKILADNSQDIDTDRVAKIKAQMDAGTLEFDYDKIAHALVQNILQSDY